jgi:hypothetical protein
MSQEKTQASSLKIEDITKVITAISGAIAGLAFLFYAFGYIIVNSYLLGFGIHEFDILKPNYLSAGVTFVLANSIAIFTPVGLALVLLKILEPKSYKAISLFTLLGSILAAFFSLLFASLVLNFLAGGLQSNQGINLLASWKQYSLYSFSIIIFTVILAPIAFLVVGSEESPKNIVKDSLSDKTTSMEFFRAISKSSIFFLLASFFLITGWSKDIYPQIGAEFGGGKPVTIQFVILDSKNESLFTDIGVKMSSNVSEQVKLIDENNSFITIVTSEGKAVRVTKSLIANIVFLPNHVNNVLP